jgi:hypothetical protein
LPSIAGPTLRTNAAVRKWIVDREGTVRDRRKFTADELVDIDVAVLRN